ncbi:protein kinase [Streptomyces sp. F63]|uniref:serine/threonine-protein kinase n=1 Tax=Streptomyces sp. F63 TaxID=2824887 RepID=UPI001B373D8B|nr:serine/threonine-protein kinase [Streptomyces sp. F63]MBQ0985787.1 protein kinase [Streptomyces sp. F63]
MWDCQSPPPSLTSAGPVAGRYRLDGLLGSGGVADVYAGVDLRLGRPVAVKIFRPGTEPEMEERFAQEALLLARLRHPGLVTVYDTGRHEGRAHLVMQLVEGPTLRDRATAPLPLPEVTGLGAALSDALAHVHDAGIVHRDVKPANILLDTGGAPYLTDFGISQLVGSTAHTAAGALVGTAAYMAPEQVTGEGAGPPADVYALGLVLLECLKGRLEYHGAPLEAAIARLHRAPVLPGFLPGDVAALLRAMTALDPAARPTSHDCRTALAALGGDGAAVPFPQGPHGHPAGGFSDGAVPGVPGVPAAAERGPGPSAGRPPGGDTLPGVPPQPARGRRLLAATGTAVLAAVLGTALTAPGDASGSGERAVSPPGGPRAEQPAPGAPGAVAEGGETRERPGRDDGAPARQADHRPAPSRTAASAAAGPAPRRLPRDPRARPAGPRPAAASTAGRPEAPRRARGVPAAGGAGTTAAAPERGAKARGGGGLVKVLGGGGAHRR